MDSIKYITIKGTTYKLEGGESNISAIKVGDVPFTPVNGVISLPAYPSGVSPEGSYSVLPAAYNGTDQSLVYTGEKYIWNNKQDAISNLQDIINGAAAGSTALQPTDVTKVTNMLLYGNATKPDGQATITNITSENISNYAGSGNVTVVNGTSPLAWDTDVTIGTINGTAITAKLPVKPTYEESHYRATPIVGIENATSPSTSEVTNPYLNIIENNSKSGGILIQGSGSVSVTSRGGIITIAGAPTGGNSRGISSIDKTGVNGNVDTYTITYTDNTTSTFTIHNGVDGTNGTNGRDGQNGTNGQDGRDADIWTIGSDGFWYKNGTKTEYKSKGEDGANGTNGTNGTNGADGKSAYQSYLDTTTDSPKKTEAQWVASLKGADGINGTNGRDGTNGTNGADGHTPYIQNGYWYINGVNQGVKAEGTNGQNGRDGQDGKDGKDGVVDYSIIEELISRIEVLESYHNIVSAPVITGNTPFTTSTTVSITVPSDTTVRYTTNGSEPTSSSTVYNGPFTISNSTTVKAKAFKGNSSSETVSKEFIKEQLVVNAPVINGTTPFDDSTIVTMTADSGAEIRYTMNGSNPTTSSTKYNSAITLTDSATIKAIAIKDGVTSSITTKVFTKNEPVTVDAPIISGTTPFDDTTTVTISAESGAQIRYTTNGSTPNSSSDLYTSAFTLSDSAIVKAIAIKNGTISSVATKVFTKSEPVVVTAPTITGTNPFDDNTVVTITTTESGATTYYTTDGTEPTTSSQTGGSFSISDTTTVKARSYKNGTWSETITVIFTKNEPTPSSDIYYMGTTEATSSNYQSLLNYNDSNFPTSYTPESTTGEVLYFAIPTSKTLSVVGAETGGSISQSTVDTVNGYKIIRVPASRTIRGTVNISLN